MKGRRGGFTLVEMAVVSAVLAVLAAILFPVFVQARAKAQAASCLSNIRQLGVAMICYAGDWDGCLPVYAVFPRHDVFWFDVLAIYTAGLGVFRCPAAAAALDRSAYRQGSWGYGANFQHVLQYPRGFPWTPASEVGPRNLSSFAWPAEVLAIADSQADTGAQNGPGWPAIYCALDGGWTALSDRHAGGLNGLFVDGHAKRILRRSILGLSRERAAILWGHTE